MIRLRCCPPQSHFPRKLIAYIGIPLLLLALAGVCQAQPAVVATYPAQGAERVPASAILVFTFDRPTAKHVAYSVADLDPSSGGGLITTAPDRWSPAGDTLYITPLTPLAFGHLFGMKLNLVQDADSSIYANPAYYNEVYYFTTAAQARVERVQGNVNLSLTPDVTLPAAVPVRELAGTDVSFTSARVQFLPSSNVANTDITPLDDSVTPLYEYTLPIATYLRRSGVTSLVAPVTLPRSVARTIDQGILGVRLTFYGTDETGSAVIVDAVFRVDPATITTHQASVLPPIASDVLIQSATLEWPLHGAVIAAGDTILPRAVVTGNGTGPFRAAFLMDGDIISIEEGYMEAGRPVEVRMRGPIPTRRLGEHRIQFQVETPQLFAANPISIICALPSGLTPGPPKITDEEAPAPARPPRLHGALTWLAEGRSGFRGQDPSATGWGAWGGVYDLGPTRKIEAEASMRLRFDDLGNGSGRPQHVRLRYSTPKSSLEYGDAPPAGAAETPLFMSPVPRRSAQASMRGTPLGDLEGYVALGSHPVSAFGPYRGEESDIYAAKLGRAWGQKIRTTIYAGYTHEEVGTTFFGPADTTVLRHAIYGGMATVDLPGTWTLLADGATVRHRATPGAEDGRSRTAWRGELKGKALGLDASAQAFSYQPSLRTALNPYALSDRRGGAAQLRGRIWKWGIFGNYRSEEPASRDGLIPVVRVQTGSFGGRLELNQESWVTPSFVRVTHRGANTDFVENRIATEYAVAEPLGGRTTARFDIAFIDDALRENTNRRVTSGSLVATRRHPGRMASTLTLGVEQDHSGDLHATNTTVQGSFELRWEAIPGRFLVAPFLTGASRNYELLGTKEEHYAARVQLALLHVAGLGDNAVALEGRLDRLSHLKPSLPSQLDTSVQLTVGQRFGISGL